MEKKKKYCDNWFSFVRPAVLKRASGKCEKCSAVDGGYHPETHGRVSLKVVHWNGNTKKNDQMDTGSPCPDTQFANVFAVCQECDKVNVVRLGMMADAGIRDDQLAFDFG